ncbi:MAG: T9SS type A sorting domain-containing protein [Saprospiraceae bacterium]
MRGTLVILFFVVGRLYCQTLGNFVPLTFDSIEPLWVHYSYDSTIIGHQIPNRRDLNAEFDGYGHVYTSHDIELRPLIKDGFFYKVSKTIYDADVSGGLIEKIDLSNGQVVWNNTFDLRTENDREFIARSIIKGNQLILFNIRITTVLPVFPLPVVAFADLYTEGVLKIRYYNLETGELEKLIDADSNDPTVKKIKSAEQFSCRLNILNDSLLEVLDYRLDDSTGSRLMIDTLDYQGRYVNQSDTFYSDIKNVDWLDSYWTEAYKVMKDEEDDIYWIDFYVPGDFTTDTARAHMKVLEPGGDKRIIELPFIDPELVQSWVILDVEGDYLLMGTLLFENKVDYYLIAKEDGALIQKYRIDKNIDVNHPIINQDGSLIFPLSGIKENGKYSLDIYKSENETIKLKFQFRHSVPNYQIVPASMVQLENENYLVSVMVTEVLPNNFLRGRFMTDFLISPEMLEKGIVSIQNPLKVQGRDDALIFPNPTNGNISIQFHAKKSGKVQVINLEGKTILEKDFKNETSLYLDLSGQQSGLYYLKVFERESYLGYPIFLKP